MATSVLGLKTFAASDPVDYNDVNDNYNKIDTGVKTALQGRAAHNLLDNSDFTNPVNQRGQTSYTSNGHTIDRWRDTSNATTIITQSGLTLQNNSTSSNAYWRHRVPANTLTSGKTYTMAININGDVFCGDATIDASNQVTFYGANGLYLSCSGLTSSSYWTIQIAASAGKSFSGVRWAALYEGSYTADTLPAYVPKGYAVELAEAQRYYIHDMGRFTQGIIMPSGVLRVSYPVPTTMRTNPTVIVNSLDNAVIFSNEYSTIIGLTACSFYNKKDNAILVDFSTTLNEGDYKYCVATTYATSISLSADL